MKYSADEFGHRPFFSALVYEKDGSLNLSQLLAAIMAIIGCVGFVYTIIWCKSPVLVQIAAWTFLAGAFASVLIASLPVAKAKILANATLPGDVANAVSNIARSVETSTDIQELSTRSNPNNNPNEIG